MEEPKIDIMHDVILTDRLIHTARKRGTQEVRPHMLSALFRELNRRQPIQNNHHSLNLKT